MEEAIEAAAVVVAVVAVAAPPHPMVPNTKVLNTPICLLVNGRGVDYIINLDEELISVENPPLALGETLPPPRTPTPTTGIINETSTSSVTVLIFHY